MSVFFNAAETIEFAVYIEQNGYRFYIEAMKRFPDPRVTELFQYLADEELRHERTFKNLLGNQPAKRVAQGDADPAYQGYLSALCRSHALANDEVLKQKMAALKSPTDAIDMALAFEKDSVVFFTELKHVASGDVTPIEAIIQEEMKHIQRILDVQAQLHIA